MKQLFMIAILGVSLLTSAFANPVKGVSIHVTRAFENEFPMATAVQWEVTKDYTKATFVQNEVNTEAFYNSKGEFIGTSEAITLTQLPTFAKRQFAKRYSDYTVKEAIKFEAIDETAYFISAENEKETVILKVEGGVMYVFRTTSKR